MGMEPMDRSAMCEDQRPPPPSECETASSGSTDDGGSPSNTGGNGLINIALLAGDNTSASGASFDGVSVELSSLLDGSINAEVGDAGDLDLAVTLASTLDPDGSISEMPTTLLDVAALDLLTCDCADA